MSAPAAAPAAPPAPIIIHNHYELRSETTGTAVAFDPSGPAYGTVRRNELGHVTDVNGINATLGYSFKRYLQPSSHISAYRTIGTVGVLLPHFEFGFDLKHKMCVNRLFPAASSSPPHPHPHHFSLTLLRSGDLPREPRTDLVVGLGLAWLVIPKLHIGLYG